MDCCRAALQTRMSRPPSSLTARSTSWRQKPSVRMSPGIDAPFAPRAANEIHHLARIGFFLWQVVDRDVRPLAREGDGSGAAHAGIAAGDERLAPAQPAGADIAGLAMIGARVHAARKTGPGL